MSDFKAALHAAGLVSNRQLKEAEAADFLKNDAEQAQLRKRENEKERRLQILRTSNTPDQFRPEARKLLLADPSLLHQVLSVAYERGLQNNKKGGGRLIANLLQLRTTLSKARLSEDDKKSAVDKILTKR